MTRYIDKSKSLSFVSFRKDNVYSGFFVESWHSGFVKYTVFEIEKRMDWERRRRRAIFMLHCFILLALTSHSLLDSKQWNWCWLTFHLNTVVLWCYWISKKYFHRAFSSKFFIITDQSLIVWLCCCKERRKLQLNSNKREGALNAKLSHHRLFRLPPQFRIKKTV